MKLFLVILVVLVVVIQDVREVFLKMLLEYMVEIRHVGLCRLKVVLFLILV